MEATTASLRVRFSFTLLAAVTVLASPALCPAQDPASAEGGAGLDPATVGTHATLTGPWEFTVDGRIGAPTGRLKVGEFPTGSAKAGGGGTPGTLFRLRNLGIDVSGALEGSAAFHLTAQDAVRASYLYYFLRGGTTVNQSVVFNGQEFSAGSLHTNADFYRASLTYERTLLGRSSGEQLIGSVGLSYVNFNPTLTGNTPSQSGSGGEAHGGSNSEDFVSEPQPSRHRFTSSAPTDHGPPLPQCPASWHSRARSAARSASLSSHALRISSCRAGDIEQPWRSPATSIPTRRAERAPTYDDASATHASRLAVSKLGRVNEDAREGRL